MSAWVCDFCAKPATKLQGEANEILVCDDHAAPIRAIEALEARATTAEARLGEIAATVDGWHGTDVDLWRTLRDLLDGVA